MGIFLKFSNIEGNATLQDHENWIFGKSFSWSGSRNPGSGADRRAGSSSGTRVAYQQATLGKDLDNASVLLLKAMAENDLLNEGKMHITNAQGGSPGNVLLELVFSRVRIVDVSYSFTEGLCTENVAFYFDSYDMTYFHPETGEGRQSFRDTLSRT